MKIAGTFSERKREPVNQILKGHRRQGIRRLFNGTASPGRMKLYWDGRDDFGEKAGSGVLYMLKSRDASIVRRKLILLK
jgi:hypothetical protein